MYRLLVLFFALWAGWISHALAFCGFYVAKADASLFNNKSEVIIARHNGQTVVTMSSDFQGDVKDFALVIPVPTLLKRSQVRVVEPGLFAKLDAYSGPRIVEYYDSNPCPVVYQDKLMEARDMVDEEVTELEDDFSNADTFGVSVLESYSVGEYDILILSAEESDGLKTWLDKNGYKIPSKASEVLEPYIKSEMKFFVVKVNLERNSGLTAQQLKPLQISFRSSKFGLPIRLGMANSNGPQDMIVYGFSSEGRIETTNYMTKELPSNQDIPLFMQQDFGNFYTSTFSHQWGKQKNAVFMEYGWNLDGNNSVKCDPCPTPPVPYADLREAGVFWLSGNNWSYNGKLFMTRLHVRYDRDHFPQDLQFKVTPNRRNFQLRYVTHHPAAVDADCSQAVAYYKGLRKRRTQEVNNLAKLTGWEKGNKEYFSYIHAFDHMIEKDQPFGPLPEKDEDKGLIGWFLSPFSGLPGMFLLIFGILLWLIIKRRPQPALTS
ncbi:MAG: DUF2330 domain-containing protein [Bacteroidia bacterium]|nr:DUF2330 domain-containing protein [Bacteroidia bacterium]